MFTSAIRKINKPPWSVSSRANDCWARFRSYLSKCTFRARVHVDPPERLASRARTRAPLTSVSKLRTGRGDWQWRRRPRERVEGIAGTEGEGDTRIDIIYKYIYVNAGTEKRAAVRLLRGERRGWEMTGPEGNTRRAFEISKLYSELNIVFLTSLEHNNNLYNNIIRARQPHNLVIRLVCRVPARGYIRI